jgi:hypothetical protein
MTRKALQPTVAPPLPPGLDVASWRFDPLSEPEKTIRNTNATLRQRIEFAARDPGAAATASNFMAGSESRWLRRHPTSSQMSSQKRTPGVASGGSLWIVIYSEPKSDVSSVKKLLALLPDSLPNNEMMSYR